MDLLAPLAGYVKGALAKKLCAASLNEERSKNTPPSPFSKPHLDARVIGMVQQCCRSEFSIPDPGSRVKKIPDPHQRI
jgi:hypothetical protein